MAAATVNILPFSSRWTCMTSMKVRKTECKVRWRGFTRMGYEHEEEER